MEPLKSIPAEIYPFIFLSLDPNDLEQCSRICKDWYNSINQKDFFRRYAQSLSEASMATLTPRIFRNCFSYFPPEKLFHIDTTKMTRHLSNQMTENEENKINLRITKLLGSLSWYQEIVKKNIDSCIKHWHLDNPESVKKFRESSDYIHLLLFGHFIHFDVNVTNVDLEQYRKIDLISKDNLNKLAWFDANFRLASLIAVDYELLKAADPKLLERLFLTIFSKYKIKHILHPSHPRDTAFLKLPNVLFKSFFASLTTHSLEEKNQIDHLSKNGSFIGHVFRCILSPFRTSCAESTPSTLESLNISILNDEQLDSLKQWIETTKVQINQLKLIIMYSINEESLKSFREHLKKTNVKAIQTTFPPQIQMIRNQLCQDNEGME